MIKQIGNINIYEEVELHFINAAKAFKYPAFIVDQAMWFVMRALNKEVLS